jgi:4,5-DOPA dioxygenase extradiol
MTEHLYQHDLEALLDYRRLAPDAVRAHPTDEHLQPLYVALGAAGERPAVEHLHTGISDYVLAMDAYAFTTLQ